MKIRLRVTLATALFMTSVFGGHALSARLSPADLAWIGTCMDQLKRDNPNKRVVRKYCTCMHDFFENNEKVSQSDMEHMFPPAHLMCNKQSGWKSS